MTAVKLKNSIITGTILLFPFVVWEGLYSVTGLPKLLFLGVSIIFLTFASFFTLWKLSKREVVMMGCLLSFFIGILAWNIHASPDNWISILGSLERSMGWITYVFIFLFVFLSFALGRGLLTFVTLSRMIISAGVGLSLIALGQKYGVFSESFLGSMIFEGRAMATIGQYNTLGALLTLPLGLLLLSSRRDPFHGILGGYCFLAHQKIALKEISPTSKGQKRGFDNYIVFFGVLVILFLGIWTTGSRIALLGGVGLTFLFLTPERWRKDLFLGSIFLGGIALVFSENFMSEAGRASLESRKFLFSDAIIEIRNFNLPEHILGKGFETIQPTLLHAYSSKYLAYEQIDYIPDRSHNIFLDTYIQFGIVGSIVFFMIFLIYPFCIFWKGETLLFRNIGLILLLHFGVISMGFYDISNLLFASMLVGFLFFGSGKDEEKIFLGFRYAFIFLSLLISSVSLYLLSQDAREQSSYTQSQMISDDPLELIETDTIPDGFTTWKRDDLVSKVLAKKLDTMDGIPNSSDTIFQKMCERDSYHILQVCVRKAFLQGNFSLLRTKVDKLLTLAPHDIVALSLDMELAKHEGNREKEREIAKKIISLFPSFVFAENITLSDYQKRKKEKIRVHYPLDDWSERAK